jgi:serine/threonine protein kinase
MRSTESKQKRRGGKKHKEQTIRLVKDRRFKKHRKEKHTLEPKFPVRKTVNATVAMFKFKVDKLLQSERLNVIQGLSYERTQEVGAGRSGRVFDCVLPNYQNCRVVAKEMSITKKKVGGKDSEEQDDVLKVHTFLEKCYDEMKIQLYFEKDARVVKLLGGMIKNSEKKVYCALIMEKEDTSLHAFLLSSRQLSVSIGARICLELLSLAQFTEGLGFVHNDLHAHNILCTTAGTHLKICDFGQAAAFGNVSDDVVRRGRNIEDGSMDETKKEHLGLKHWSDKADDSCDHYSLAYIMMSVLHGYYHIIVKLLRHNRGVVHSPLPPNTSCIICPRTKKRREFSPHDRRVATLVQPVTLLLKDCLEEGKVLKVDEITTALNALVRSTEAAAVKVLFVLSEPSLLVQ